MMMLFWIIDAFVLYIDLLVNASKGLTWFPGKERFMEIIPKSLKS